jgi:Na+-transporting NADH:ubiquinone oxidoreductase subunit C
MLLGMAVTGIAYGGYTFTKSYIDANTEKRINDSIALLYSPEDGFKRNESQEYNKYREAEEKYIDAIYEVLDSEDTLVAVIYDMSVQGRNAVINTLVAVDPYTDTIIGVTYYNHAETPNIGEKYTREEEIDKLIGQTIDEIVVDKYTGASTTWGALVLMYGEITSHYNERGVHIDG